MNHFELNDILPQSSFLNIPILRFDEILLHVFREEIKLTPQQHKPKMISQRYQFLFRPWVSLFTALTYEFLKYLFKTSTLFTKVHFSVQDFLVDDERRLMFLFTFVFRTLDFISHLWGKTNPKVWFYSLQRDVVYLQSFKTGICIYIFWCSPSFNRSKVAETWTLNLICYLGSNFDHLIVRRVGSKSNECARQSKTKINQFRSAKDYQRPKKRSYESM